MKSYLLALLLPLSATGQSSYQLYSKNPVDSLVLKKVFDSVKTTGWHIATPLELQKIYESSPSRPPLMGLFWIGEMTSKTYDGVSVVFIGYSLFRHEIPRQGAIGKIVLIKN